MTEEGHAKEGVIERLLRRDRAITLVGLAILSALAWAYLLGGARLGAADADMGMAAMGMSDMSGMAPSSWDIYTWLLMIAMWWVMMIAMMTPSATPTILLYGRVHRHAQGQVASGVAPTGAFAAGYLLVWLGFSLGAAALHWGLERAGLISAMTMGSQSRWLSGGVLIAAGLYQLSPLKHTCLSHCRAPASFLARHWRPHATGALRLGALHGAYCVGCCWMLMALLFVGGVMNLVWIAALAILVLVEKLLPPGRLAGLGTGAVLIAWGIATLLA